jgi:hypothetical protein
VQIQNTRPERKTKKFPSKPEKNSQPTAAPTKPTRNEPGTNPEMPGMNPENPGNNPEKAGMNPEQPGKTRKFQNRPPNHLPFASFATFSSIGASSETNFTNSHPSETHFTNFR